MKEKFGGARVGKLCIDGGFTCPNRADGSGGCAFCGGEPSVEPDIAAQVKKQLAANEKHSDKFIAYFQEYTNTFAPASVLKAKYDAALCDERIVALAIATRPDCIDGEVADLIKSYADKYYVWVELGLQTSNDLTAEKINRGYNCDRFTAAVDTLAARGIDVVAHIIFGLPGETDADMMNTVEFINRHRVSGVKIHSLYVMRGTRLCDMYERGEYTPQSFDEYCGRVVSALARLRNDIIVHRITGDCPRGKLIAPEWNNRKKLVRNAVERALEEQNLTQGSKILDIPPL